MIKVCKQCGNTFETENNRKRLCDDCKAQNKEKHAKEYCVKYRQENRRHVSVEKEDYIMLKNIAKVSKMSITKVVHLLLTEAYKE